MKPHDFSSSTNENNSNESSSHSTSNNILGGAELRHVDSNFELSSIATTSGESNKKNINTTRLSRVIDDSARHHYRYLSIIIQSKQLRVDFLSKHFSKKGSFKQSGLDLEWTKFCVRTQIVHSKQF